VIQNILINFGLPVYKMDTPDKTDEKGMS
jgi:hypothetical protein